MGFFTYSRALDSSWFWAALLWELFQFVLRNFHHFVDHMQLYFNLILELSPTCAQEIPPLYWSCVVLQSWRDPPLPLCEYSTSLQFQQKGVGDHLKVDNIKRYFWRKVSGTFQAMLVRTMRSQSKQFGHSKVYIHCSSPFADQQCSHLPERKKI